MMWVVENWVRDEWGTCGAREAGPCKAGGTADLGHDLGGEYENQLSLEK